MSETLYPYYQRELSFLRQLTQEFARQYPAVAGRLLLEPNASLDPHVERLLEGFALLTARVHHKIDDEFPELTDALLSVLYPHYLAPVPSVAIVQFELDPLVGELPDGFLIKQHSILRTNPVRNLRCTYRTGYPVTLWPVALKSARLLRPPFPPNFKPPPRTAAALRLEFECQSSLPFTALSLEKLRLYLNGEDTAISALYELIFNQVTQVHIRPLDSARSPEAVVLKPEHCLFPVGFERSEGLLPYPNQSFLGYRLLTEFFAFPSKFQFVDLGGWRRLQETGCQRRCEFVLFLNRAQPALEQVVETGTFLQGCTPVINLFEQTAEPIALTQTRYEYPVMPDVTHPLGMEVYQIENVASINGETNAVTEYQPFYSFHHGTAREHQRVFWYASRHPGGVEDRGTEITLHLTDLDFNPREPAVSTLVVRTLCTNRDLPTKLAQTGETLRFELEGAAPLQRLRCVRTPTSTLRPPLRRGAYWRLISHLSLNHLSLTDPVEGRAALQEMLSLYDFSDPQAAPQLAAVTRNLIEGITAVNVRQVVGRTGANTASGFCRGAEVTLEFDEQKYIGTGVYLFASVLERFLGLYVSINSFSQLVARIQQSEGILKKWAPRAGEQPLL